MKYWIISLVVLIPFSTGVVGCNKQNEPSQSQISGANSKQENSQGNKVKMTINSISFTATLNDNATANAFKSMLPITINMNELNSNEKYYYFSGTLPSEATIVGSIQSGDLMLYGNNCLVLFYNSFNTSYSYTRIGKVDNTSGLKEAVGTNNVTVKFEME